jgi:transcription-repair coupling factor (superfamily II helicase)
MAQIVTEPQEILSASPVSPRLPSGANEHLAWTGLFGSARGLAIAEAARRHPGPVLVVGRNAHLLQQLEDEIRFYLGAHALPVLPFPDWESLPYDAVSPHPDIVSQRLATLYALPALAQGIVLATASTLMHRLAPREYVAGHSFMLTRGAPLDASLLRTQLAQAAYQNVSQVMEPGEFALRGGLIDIFPMGGHSPFRLDLLDDQIESIREFDPATQRSGRQLDEIKLLPAREFPLTETAIHKFRQSFRARFEGDPQRSGLYRDVSQGLSPAGIEYYLPLFFDRTASFFDYLPANALCIIDGTAAESATAFEREIEERFRELRLAQDRPCLSPSEVFFASSAFFERCRAYPRVSLVELDDTTAPAITGPAISRTVRYDALTPASLPVDPKADTPYHALFEYLADYQGRVLLVAETAGRRETLLALLHDHAVEPSPVADWDEFRHGSARLALTVAALEKGLRLYEPPLSVITEPQLYGERAAQRRRRLRAGREPEAIVRSLAELKVGDAVVHEDHGIGRYLGLQTLDVGDGPTEFLTLEYADGDKLYIPVLSLHLISRYTGTDPDKAPLHKLGGDAWEKAKRRAMEKAHDAAVELLEVQALRAARQGHAFPRPDAHYHAFVDAFPFEETPDQLKAIEDTLNDMESTKPMDRLVCGDVGFGKTEVALRAAFLAVHGHAQVAVLVPTTLLAQQHFETFHDRFAGLPYRVELLSRFRSHAEEAQVLAGLASGAVDVVIGTHRLLQEDVRFKNLGLVILDEEHRFGVRQKERLKKLRAEVDILTLTATPIPRTLNMALAGMREISIMAQPPEGRLSINTFIYEWNRDIIREACLREIRRGGQVFFLHNEVRTIDSRARDLQELVPEATIRVAHGQMPERELERIMLDFYHQRFNVLVCSTIIESGIDVPSANTIIIERADKFGLAQLHQLRGRVGRSRHRAYAYLLIPGWKAITEDARKRLEAFGSLGDLGAGFVLASHDLEIRGAGELLGEAQSGVIDEVGFSLYSELLARAVQSLRAGQTGESPVPPSGAEVNLHAPALLPEDYLPDVHLRLVLYKRIAAAHDLEALTQLREEIIDRFGALPDSAKRLFSATAIKIRATPLGVRKIDVGPKGARIEFVDKPNVDPGLILKLFQSAPRTYRFDGQNRVRILSDMPKPEDRIQALNAFIDALTPRETRAVAATGR